MPVGVPSRAECEDLDAEFVEATAMADSEGTC